MNRPKFVAGYKAALILVESLTKMMKETKVTRSDLARRLDVDRSAITKLLVPGRNLTVFKAAMMAEAMGGKLHIEVRPADEQPKQEDRVAMEPTE